MAVPDTDTFTLQNVCTEVGVNSLLDAFLYANSLLFDPVYNNDSYAPANSLLRFRNYGVVLSTYGDLNYLNIGSDIRLLDWSTTIYNGTLTTLNFQVRLRNVTQGGVTVSSIDLTVNSRSAATFTGSMNMYYDNFNGDEIEVTLYCTSNFNYYTMNPSLVNIPY